MIASANPSTTAGVRDIVLVPAQAPAIGGRDRLR